MVNSSDGVTPKKTNGYFEEVFEFSETGKVIFSEDGTFLKVNRRALEALYPLTTDDLADLKYSEFLDFLYDSSEEIDESIRKAIFSQYQSYDTEPRFKEVITSQKMGLYLVEAKPLSMGAVLFTFVNITRSRRVEENIIQLSRFNNQLLHAIEAVATGIIISHQGEGKNRFLYVNDAFCRFINRSRVDVISLNWDGILDIFNSGGDKEKIINALESRSDAEVSSDMDGEDGVSHYTFRVCPVFQKQGDFDLYIGVLTDVSLLKQREMEFFHAQKLESLGQLSAGVAHDFNNILSIIGGYSIMAKGFLKEEGEKALREDEKLEKLEKYLNSIDAAAFRGAGLTRKMLTFSRHKVVSKSVVDVCHVVKEQAELLTPLIGVNINFSIIAPDYALNVRGSADSIEQIVMNLVVNARDALLQGGDLCVEIFAQGANDAPEIVRDEFNSVDDCVVIRVTDNGMGMDKKTLDRMFDPFFTTKDQGKGTGLGLSVVYGLIKEMGGVLDVSSVLHEGTVMSCYFPKCNENTKMLPSEKGVDLSTVCFDGFTVLVAEDEPDLLVLVTKMLEDLGFNVIGAKNGNEALELADAHEDEIDILLTDVVMPEVNGVKLAELVTAMNPEIKVVFMSGYPSTGEMAPVDLPDDVEFVMKPVDYENLARLLLGKLREDYGGKGPNAVMDNIPHWGNAINV